MQIKKYTFPFVLLLSMSCGTALQNSNNLHVLKIGMNVKEVDSFMGSPLIIDTTMVIRDSIDSTLKAANTFMYGYESVIGSSDYYKVTISKTDSCVVSIGYGD